MYNVILTLSQYNRRRLKRDAVTRAKLTFFLINNRVGMIFNKYIIN